MRTTFTRRRVLAISAAALFQAACRKGEDFDFGAQTSEAAPDGQVIIVQFDDVGRRTGPAQVERLMRSDAEWQRQLSPQQYYVTRKQHTDTPFTGTYYHMQRAGVYRCVCCDNAVFSSDAKYDSGTGWPSFKDPIAPENVIVKRESNLTLHTGLEVTCKRCDAHLGHVFDDGPAPKRLRYCINESALRFVAATRS